MSLSEVAFAAVGRSAYIATTDMSGSDRGAAAQAGLANTGAVPRSVTFVMPALNEEAKLAHAVSEVIPATVDLDDYEIVVVNDGSTDCTGEIAEALARENPIPAQNGRLSSTECRFTCQSQRNPPPSAET